MTPHSEKFPSFGRVAPLLLLEHRRSPITALPPNLDEMRRASRLEDSKGRLMGGDHP
jgi:hypothetical protein